MIRIVIFFLLWISISFAQKSIFTNGNLNVDIEYRPRTEVRRGYRQIPNTKDNVSLQTSHRARINLDYQIPNFLVHTTLQDIRIWGDTDPRDADGKAQFYEFYVEPKISKNITVRVGRQRVKYDNQRFFAENNWRQAGGKHDAVRFIYHKNNINSDVILAYNQNQENLFSNQFDIPFDIYRGLIANYTKFNLNNNTLLTSLNFADEYTDPSTDNKDGHWKYTHGATLAITQQSLQISLSVFYQWGAIENGKKHNAYYIEPLLKWNVAKNYHITLGAQIFSGDQNQNDTTSTAFLTQYGAFHRHNGQLDYTQLTVRTNEHEGIINPYITQDIYFNKKLCLNWQSHVLGANSRLLKTKNNEIEKLNKFYAWENDFKFSYKANHYTNIEFAYLFLIANEGVNFLSTPQNGNPNEVAQFLYLAVSWTPKLYQSKY